MTRGWYCRTLNAESTPKQIHLLTQLRQCFSNSRERRRFCFAVVSVKTFMRGMANLTPEFSTCGWRIGDKVKARRMKFAQRHHLRGGLMDQQVRFTEVSERW